MALAEWAEHVEHAKAKVAKGQSAEILPPMLHFHTNYQLVEALASSTLTAEKYLETLKNTRMLEKKIDKGFEEIVGGADENE